MSPYAVAVASFGDHRHMCSCLGPDYHPETSSTGTYKWEKIVASGLQKLGGKRQLKTICISENSYCWLASHFDWNLHTYTRNLKLLYNRCNLNRYRCPDRWLNRHPNRCPDRCSNRCHNGCLYRHPYSCHNIHSKRCHDRCLTDSLIDALSDVLTETLTDARPAPNRYPNRGTYKCNGRHTWATQLILHCNQCHYTEGQHANTEILR